ncbi:hypothetical protein BH11BAC4_BH11BAC4_07070 [soil metagenome]
MTTSFPLSISTMRPVFIVVFLMTASATLAQWPGYKAFPLAEDNKLIKINTTFKTQKGYIYAGTSNGLYKFDGERFIRIYFENRDYIDTVTALFQDNSEKIWVGFNSGRIAHVSGGKLVYYNPEEGTPKKKITAFLQDKKNIIWFSTAGEGLYYIKENHIGLFDDAEGMSDLNVTAIALTQNGEVIAATDQGINTCVITGNKKTVVTTGPKQGLPDYIVSCIEPAGDEKFWFGMQDNGFCLYDHLTKKITVPAAVKTWNHGQVNAISLENNILWIATQQDGLLRYDIKRDSISVIVEARAFTNIKNLLKDKQGNTWLTCADLGLVRTPGESLKLFPLKDPPIFEHMHVILYDKKGNIWVNDEDNRIIKYSLQHGAYQPQKIMLQGLTDKTDITSLYQDGFGNIWIGTMGKGIYLFNPLNERYRIFTENSLFKDASVISINGRSNKIFASSLQGAMIVELDAANKDINSIYHFMNYDNRSTGTNYIYSIFEDTKNRTWFATDGRGLSMMENNSFTYYTDNKQIKDDHIYSITEDRQGNIWFSTASAGIYKFDGKNFSNYLEKDGLSSLTVSALKTDASGNIIIVQRKGLDILNPVTGNIFYINNNQGIGLLNAEDLGAITLDTSGNVMVSTMNGILSYSYPTNSFQTPTTIIESVQLFLKDLDENAGNVFNHDENSFTFNYTGLYYSNPEQLYYQYKLEGFDSSWILTKDKSKTFPKLAPGEYRFRIQSALNKNFRNADEASYHFIIKIAFYKTAWFIGACLLVFILLLYWYIKNREHSLKRMERLRQEKIQFRFEVLRNQVNPHFLFNSFNTLISTIEEDPKMGIEYVEQLSDFFRHIVNYRDKDIIPLKEELGLLQTYFFLQQKRYGDHLRLQVNIIETAKEENFIPPLTLQLLIENAIKHNAVSKETILNINIDLEDDYLTVSNNLNQKINKDTSSGMGLQNIINRYNILSDKKVQVKNDNRYFIVLLPLLKNYHA